MSGQSRTIMVDASTNEIVYPTVEQLVTANGLTDGLAKDSEVVKLTGDQTIAGVKNFSVSPLVPTPTSDTDITTKSYVDTTVNDKYDTLSDVATSGDYADLDNKPDLDTYALDTTVVKLTGDQTIAGVKNFSVSPLVPTPTSDTDVTTKSYVDTTVTALDTTVVKLTGDQTISGVKNFSVSPVVPTPTSDTDVTTKSYVDTTISTAVDNLSTVATSGDYDDLDNKPDLSNLNKQLTTDLESTVITLDVVPNTTYQYGTLTSLTLSSVENSLYESVIMFDSGDTATTLEYPETLSPIGSVSITANTSYIIAICYNIIMLSIVD